MLILLFIRVNVYEYITKKLSSRNLFPGVFSICVPANDNIMDKVAQLLRTKFYASCPKHDKTGTWFCKDCLSDPLCESCLRKSEHRCHELLQVFKASRKEVIRVQDIEKFWNVADVQPFAINAKAVVYIHERQTKGNPGCSICGGHNLDKKYAFCSVECQFGRLRTEGGKDLSFSSNDRSVHSKVSFSSSSSSSFNVSDKASNSSNGSVVKRRRKGRAVRTPFY